MKKREKNKMMIGTKLYFSVQTSTCYLYWPALRKITNWLGLHLHLSHHPSSSCCAGRCVWWAWCWAALLRRRVLGQAPVPHTSHLADLTVQPAWAYMQTQSSNLTGTHADRNPEPSSCRERKIILMNLYEHGLAKWVSECVRMCVCGVVCVSWPVRARKRVDVCAVPEVSAGLEDEVSRAVGEHLYIVWEEVKRSVTWMKQ